MAKKAVDYNDLSRRYILGTIQKWLLIRGVKATVFFQISPTTWNSRKNLESDFTLKELRHAIRGLEIPQEEVNHLLGGIN